MDGGSIKGHSDWMTFSGAHSNWRSDILAELSYYLGKHKKTFSYAAWKTVVV